MNRARILHSAASPIVVAACAAVAVGGAVIAAALAAARPGWLLWGLLGVMAACAVAALGARRGTAGWPSAAVLLAAGLIPGRVFDAWQPQFLGRSFDIVAVIVLVCAGLVLMWRLLVSGSGARNELALPQTALFVLAIGGVAVHAGEYGDLDPVWRGLIRIFVPMLAFWVVATSRLRERDAMALVRLMLVVGWVMALLGLRWPLQLWRYQSASFLFGSQGVWGVRTMTPLGGSGLSALALGMMLPAAVVMAVLDRGWLRAAWVLCSFTLLAGVAMSVSRTGVMGCAAAVLLFAWLNRMLIGRRVGIVLLVLAISAAIVSRLVSNYRHYTNFAKLTHAVDMDSPSDRLRWFTVRAAAAVGARRPVLGSGVGRFYPRDWSIQPKLVEGNPTARDPHCLYLLGFAEMGLPGLLVVIWLLGKPFADFMGARRTASGRRAMLLSAFAGSALAIMMYSATSSAMFVHLRVATVAWWVLGLGYQFRRRAEAAST